MNHKVIIFDLDGVLFDTTEHVINFFLEWFPTLTREKVHEMWTGNFDEEISKFRVDNKPIDETPERRREKNRIYSEKKSRLQMFPGIKELLLTLHKSGRILVINTLAREENCIPLLEQAGILNTFDFVATKKLSPSKIEKFKIIAERYAVSSEEMIFVTDTLGDIRDADVANVPTIAVTWGAHDHSYFNREKHNNLIKIVDSVSELRECLLK